MEIWNNIFNFYIILFKSPIVDILGTKLVLNNNYNKSSKVIFVMSGYGSDNYFNNSYLQIAKKLSNLTQLNNSKDINFIISGRFQVYPESQIIKKILVNDGIDENTIITLDTEYKNTYENLKLFFDIGQKYNLDMKSEITILTSPLHSKRTSLILNKNFTAYKTNIIISDNVKLKTVSKLKLYSMNTCRYYII